MPDEWRAYLVGKAVRGSTGELRPRARYVRFADKTASARASRDRRERKKTEYENSVAHLKTKVT